MSANEGLNAKLAAAANAVTVAVTNRLENEATELDQENEGSSK